MTDLVPLVFYENGRFFWRALEAGYIFVDYQQWNLSVIGRYRYFDISAEFQNRVRGSGVDPGIRYRYILNDELKLDAEVMDDTHGLSSMPVS